MLASSLRDFQPKLCTPIQICNDDDDDEDTSTATTTTTTAIRKQYHQQQQLKEALKLQNDGAKNRLLEKQDRE
jgi:hypothetical protein